MNGKTLCLHSGRADDDPSRLTFQANRNMTAIPERRLTQTPPVDLEEEGLWIEILAPVESAGPMIADALDYAPCFPPGVIVGRSAYGSILLNQKAWTLLHPTLKAIRGLQTRHSTQRPIRPNLPA